MIDVRPQSVRTHTHTHTRTHSDGNTRTHANTATHEPCNYVHRSMFEQMVNHDHLAISLSTNAWKRSALGVVMRCYVSCLFRAPCPCRRRFIYGDTAKNGRPKLIDVISCVFVWMRAMGIRKNITLHSTCHLAQTVHVFLMVLCTFNVDDLHHRARRVRIDTKGRRQSATVNFTRSIYTQRGIVILNVCNMWS